MTDPVTWAAWGCALLSAHSAVNARWGRRTPRMSPPDVGEVLAVLVPARNEAHRIGPLLRSLLAQRGVPRMEITVLDDGSTDGTAEVVRDVARANGAIVDDCRAQALTPTAAAPLDLDHTPVQGRAPFRADATVRILSGAPLPPGWLGKPHACQQLADRADPAARLLVFADADVVLAPHALASLAHLARDSDAGVLSTHLRMLAVTPAERLCQPLLGWTWLTLFPMRAMQRPRWGGMASAEGQLLVFDRTAYERGGGHAGVRDQVLEDWAIARAVGRAGGRLVCVDGAGLADCRMYTGWREVAEGYAKSMCTAAPLPVGLLALLALLFCYVLPPVAACFGSLTGLCGYLAAVTGRWITARACRDRTWPDALAHPVSVAVAVGLFFYSHWLDRRGLRTWKGRAVHKPACGRDSRLTVDRD